MWLSRRCGWCRRCQRGARVGGTTQGGWYAGWVVLRRTVPRTRQAEAAARRPSWRSARGRRSMGLCPGGCGGRRTRSSPRPSRDRTTEHGGWGGVGWGGVGWGGVGAGGEGSREKRRVVGGWVGDGVGGGVTRVGEGGPARCGWWGGAGRCVVLALTSSTPMSPPDSEPATRSTTLRLRVVRGARARGETNALAPPRSRRGESSSGAFMVQIQDESGEVDRSTDLSSRLRTLRRWPRLRDAAHAARRGSRVGARGLLSAGSVNPSACARE